MFSGNGLTWPSLYTSSWPNAGWMLVHRLWQSSPVQHRPGIGPASLARCVNLVTVTHATVTARGDADKYPVANSDTSDWYWRVIKYSPDTIYNPHDGAPFGTKGTYLPLDKVADTPFCPKESICDSHCVTGLVTVTLWLTIHLALQQDVKNAKSFSLTMDVTAANI